MSWLRLPPSSSYGNHTLIGYQAAAGRSRAELLPGDRIALGASGADEVRAVPAVVHRDLLDVLAGLRRVDHVAVAHVHRHVPDPVVVQQVTGLDVGLRDVLEGSPLAVGVPRDGHPGRSPGRLHQAGAVEAGRAGRAPLGRP